MDPWLRKNVKRLTSLVTPPNHIAAKYDLPSLPIRRFSMSTNMDILSLNATALADSFSVFAIVNH